MTFTAVGVSHGVNTAALSLSNQTVGNLLVLEVINDTNNTVQCTGLTGGGAIWLQAGGAFNGSTNAWSATAFIGTVRSTGSQTATPTWSGTTPTGYIIAAQEFSSTIGHWQVNSVGHLDSSGTSAWTSLTAIVSGELYWGYAANKTSAVAGSTSGYTYNANVDAVNNGMAYNPACGTGATSPTWGDTSEAFGIMLLIGEIGEGLSVPGTGTPGKNIISVPQANAISTSW